MAYILTYVTISVQQTLNLQNADLFLGKLFRYQKSFVVSPGWNLDTLDKSTCDFVSNSPMELWAFIWSANSDPNAVLGLDLSSLSIFEFTLA